MARVMRLLPDFGPARENPAFRRLLAGGLLSGLGTAMTSFAVVLQIWDLSRSSLDVGLLGLTFVPVLIVGLLGGSIADAALLAVAGAADTLTVTFRASMVQTVTPDEFRGRVSSVEYIIGTGGAPLGNVESGTVASLTSPVVSAVSGGAGCFAIAAAIALAFPAFTRYHAERAAALSLAPGGAMEVTDNPDQERFEIRVDGELAGFVQYQLKDGVLALLHTETDPRFRGHGVAGHLVQSTLDTARERHLAVLPYCPFARTWIGEHPEYADLIPPDKRARFNL